MNKLQVIIIVFAVVVALVAVLVFSGVLPGLRPFGAQRTSALTMWGTLPEEALSESISNFNQTFRNIDFSYLEKKPESFEAELVNALAAGEGPELVVLGSDLILKHRDKILTLGPEILTQRTFRDTFLNLGELLVRPEGILGLPLVADPLVLYFNRDLFQSAGIAAPPKTWDEFLTSSQTLTKLDGAGNILVSGAALGLAENVSHFKEILSLLALQTGSPRPEENALRFFAEFSNSQKASYSWAPSRPSSREAFANGSLAMYFGLASEFPELREANPHLNFDLAPVPQVRGADLNLTYGKFVWMGISKSAPDPLGAWRVMQFLVSAPELEKISKNILLAPSRRELLSGRPPDPVLETVFREAVKARSWLDPEPARTTEIFQDMVKSVYSGRKTTAEAVRDAQTQLQKLYTP